MPKKFKRVHKQSREVKIGTWRQVCDLDKRLWSDPVEEGAPEPDPIIAWVPVLMKDYGKKVNRPIDLETGLVGIRSLTDLQGLHLGR